MAFSSINAMGRLVQAVQELSLAREMGLVQSIVRKAARELTGAEGATFVLRDGDHCHYVDEDAISPLWKGKKFPLSTCISGWVMLNKTHAAIEDIYQDSRIPHNAYRPTFVRSLVMVPIRSVSPIGAIGNYWSANRMASVEEIAALQALADTTSTALENIRLYDELRNHVEELEKKNYELTRFAWIAGHDLQEPLRMISLYADLIQKDLGYGVPPSIQNHVKVLLGGTHRLRTLISDLLTFSVLDRTYPSFVDVPSRIAVEEACGNLKVLFLETKAQIVIGNLPTVSADGALLTSVFQNLISNALKFQKAGVTPELHVSAVEHDANWVFGIRDNGIGILPNYQKKVFGFFERLHSQDVYKGSGIGLASCKKIVDLHGGQIWYEPNPGQGVTFYFTIPKN